MERTQIQLTEEQALKVREAAAARGVSMAAYIREALEDRLTAERASDQRARAIAAVGGYRSGRSDVSKRHDDQLDEAFGE